MITKAKKTNNRYIATVILLLVILGFLISYPFSHSFWGKLVSSGCCAAAIGGLADWFGVTALFRKPLGIPFRTEIIPRNREKLVNSLISMVQDELLNKEILKNKINGFNISEKIIFYLNNLDGKKDIKDILNRIILDILERIDAGELAGRLEKLLGDIISGLKVSPYVVEALEWTVKNGYDEDIIDFLIVQAGKITGTPQVNSILSTIIYGILQKIRKTSARENLGSRFAFKVLFAMYEMLGMTPGKIARRMQSEATVSLKKLKQPGDINRNKIREMILQAIPELKSDLEMLHKIDSYAIDLIKRINLSAYVSKLLYTPGEGNAQNVNLDVRRLEGIIGSIVDRVVDSFGSSKQQQEKLDNYLKSVLTRLIDEKHGEIGRMVKEKLDLFTNDMLVEFIETRAGNDLQIIRINGSVVGGMVGMVIFLATYFIDIIFYY